MTSANYQAYRAARDLLLELRTDYAGACEKFAWPALGEQFSWAHDWFDVMAQGNAGSRKWSSINGTTAGAMSRADSIDRRRGLAMRQRASRISCSRSAPGGGRCTGSSAASRSPSSH